MFEFLACVLVVWFCNEMQRYYKKTGDASIQGYLEYLKDTYYTKHERPKRKPQPGSEAHYQAWRAERMKEKNEGVTK